MKCPQCGKFLSNISAKKRLLNDEIFDVKGTCIKHGEVEPNDWEADDFNFEDDEE